jgi:hypothetical protein
VRVCTRAQLPGQCSARFLLKCRARVRTRKPKAYNTPGRPFLPARRNEGSQPAHDGISGRREYALAGARRPHRSRLPDGGKIDLPNVDQFNFNWQLMYDLARPVHLPAGTVIHYIATYDNSAADPLVVNCDTPYREVTQERKAMASSRALMNSNRFRLRESIAYSRYFLQAGDIPSIFGEAHLLHRTVARERRERGCARTLLELP